MTTLTAEQFESLLGAPIQVLTATGEEPWRVDRVERRAAHALRNDQPFNLYLSAPLTQANRAQGIRRGRIAGGDEFEFFAVPIAANTTGISFEVIFN